MNRFQILSIIAYSFSLMAGEERKPYVEKITGTDFVLEMTPIPGGAFKLGSPPGESGRKDHEGPPVEVEIKPFYMSTFEVRWGLFGFYAFDEQDKKLRLSEEELKQQPQRERDADAVSGPTETSKQFLSAIGMTTKDTDDYPAACMTHHCAMEFCRWLAAKTGKPYRLATEYACRAGSNTPYSFGSDSAALKEHGWFAGNGDGQAQPVGKKKPNPWGLYDMHGNVREWVVDLYDAKTYSKWATSKQVGPVVIPGPEVFGHVARGGSWADEPPGCRSAARYVSDESWSEKYPLSIWWHSDATWIGIRVVCPVEEQENLRGIKSASVKQSDDK
jgi:formylglycine-generating enzyme required for sulfatase activity